MSISGYPEILLDGILPEDLLEDSYTARDLRQIQRKVVIHTEIVFPKWLASGIK